ncbi:MAG: hypothetical protein KDI64_22430, partial [Candidatus Accumulibacter sp.]|nr:hypothetical protein [Accumulibacter sp.]
AAVAPLRSGGGVLAGVRVLLPLPADDFGWPDAAAFRSAPPLAGAALTDAIAGKLADSGRVGVRRLVGIYSVYA